MTSQPNFRRLINRFIGFTTSVIGVILVYFSVLLFEAELAQVAVITAGLLVLLWGGWYALNPFMSNERRFLALRAEVERFIGLVRELNQAATTPGAEEEFERAKARVHDAVERMARFAGKEEGPAR